MGVSTHLLQGENRQASVQTGNQKRRCGLGVLGATYWTPAGRCKAVEVDRPAARIHTSHFKSIISSPPLVQCADQGSTALDPGQQCPGLFVSFSFLLPHCSRLSVFPDNFAFLWPPLRRGRFLTKIQRNYKKLSVSVPDTWQET